MEQDELRELLSFPVKLVEIPKKVEGYREIAFKNPLPLWSAGLIPGWPSVFLGAPSWTGLAAFILLKTEYLPMMFLVKCSKSLINRYSVDFCFLD